VSKPGPKSDISDIEIALEIRSGKTDTEIARIYHVGRNRIRKIRNLPNCSVIGSEMEPFRAVALLELNQEETRNEFSDQLHEYTKNYKDAMKIGDIDSASKWSMLRLRLLEQMIKISGIDRTRTDAGPSVQQIALDLTDEEVERRAREILAKRQR
jgi:hypothetical protein